MKKILSIPALIGWAICTSAQSNSHASTNGAPVSPILISAIADRTASGYLNNIRTRAVRDFEKNFTANGNEKWYQMPYGFRATFKLDDIDYRVDYDKKGNRLDALRTYTEKKLPSTIRSMVKTVYYDYSIVLVEEITKPRNETTYIIHLEGETEWINIRAQNREMEEWQRFDKAKESSITNK